MPPYRHASMPCQRRLPERPARAACGLCLAPSLDVQTRPANRHEAGDKVERRGEERRGEERRGPRCRRRKRQKRSPSRHILTPCLHHPPGGIAAVCTCGAPPRSPAAGRTPPPLPPCPRAPASHATGRHLDGVTLMAVCPRLIQQRHRQAHVGPRNGWSGMGCEAMAGRWSEWPAHQRCLPTNTWPTCIV